MAAGVPGQLWLVESFLNSVDVESAQDDLASPERFRRWLAAHHQPDAATSATADDLSLARELRTGLREVVAGHDHGADVRSDRLDELAAQVPMRVSFSGGATLLAPTADGVPGFLGEVLAAVALAEHDGSWRRLKLCRDSACQAVFYDRSRNASRCWCSMAVCGNRSKTRSYRRRRAATSG